MTTYREELKSRFAALGLIVLVVVATLAVRLWTMQVLNGETYAAQAENNRVRRIPLSAPRGNILDREGRPLVVNRSSMAVSVDPADDTIRDLVIRGQSATPDDDPTPTEIEDVFGTLAALLGTDSTTIYLEVIDSRREALRPRVVAIDAPMEVVGPILERQDEFPWARAEEIALREYPNGSVAAHLLGYSGEISEAELASSDEFAGYVLGDVVGKTGAERQFENVLQGDKGWRRIEVNASGRAQRVVSEQVPVPGRDVKLTIDLDVQRVAEQELEAAFAEARLTDHDNAVAGAAVVLDVRTGEVLAMASAPTFDPTLFLGGISTADWERLNAKDSEYPLNNRAIMAAYPPASTFKAVTGLAGLGVGITYENKTYRCDGKWTDMGEQWPKWCWRRSGHGTVSFRTGIEESCDTVFYEIGYELYKRKKEELQAYSRSFGLGSVTGIDLPGEVPGRIPDAEWKRQFNKNYPEYQLWLPGDTVNMAIGQGDVLTTPLQMASVYAGIANDGAAMRPHVLMEVLDRDGNTQAKAEVQQFATLDASPAGLAVIERSLVDVTKEGTAFGAFRGFRPAVAGKTGTAEVKGKDDYAWFCGYAPAGDPRYAVAVVIEQGGHGGAVAAPAARNIFAQLLDQPLTRVHAKDESR
jgi:penicillin-binding protein 2